MGESPPGDDLTYGISFLYPESPTFDAGALIERLNPVLRSELIAATEAAIAVAHPDHTVQVKEGRMPAFTQIVRYYTPFNAADFQAALDQTWDWEEAEEFLHRCGHRVRMGDVIGSGLPYKDRYAIITAVAVAWTDATRPAAVSWEPAGCLVDPARLSARMSRRCNVRMFNIEGGEGRTLMDTLGLAAIGLPDLQLDFVDLDPSVVAKWLYGAAQMTFERGDTIEDGHTIDGVEPGQRWRCVKSFSLVGPRRVVIDVDAGRHSGFSSRT